MVKNMNVREANLEQRVAYLTSEVARLRRLMSIAFSVMAVLFVAGFVDRDLALIVAGISVVLWAVMLIATSFATALNRRNVSRQGVLEKTEHLL